MKLDLDYLNQRHAYWKQRIGEAGIWKAESFTPVTIVIRRGCKSYNGMFQRRVRKKFLKKEISDKIIIYNKVEDFPVKFLDSVLVHEMIHQYIFQTGIKDSSAHGHYFRHYMHQINNHFGDELKINITDKNPAVQTEGEGKMVHLLLFAYFENGYCYCGVVHPGKRDYFEKLMQSNRFLHRVIKYHWAQSNNLYFSQFRRCMTRFHGVRQPHKDVNEFCRRYKVSPLSS